MITSIAKRERNLPARIFNRKPPRRQAAVTPAPVQKEAPKLKITHENPYYTPKDLYSIFMVCG